MANFRYLQGLTGYNVPCWSGLNTFSSKDSTARGE